MEASMNGHIRTNEGTVYPELEGISLRDVIEGLGEASLGKDNFRHFFYSFFKRVIDMSGGLFVILLFSPLFVGITILQLLTQRGPVFFTQNRVGRYGKTIKVRKFRTMYMYEINGEKHHSDKLLETESHLLEAYKKNSYKLVDDPRITPLGKILRRFSLDELPQLFSVLTGEMSLVGPRAFQKEELEHQQEVYPETTGHVRAMLKCKPGVSGPWQVMGRSLINFDKRVEIDALYSKKLSILYDIWIMLKTPIAMLTGKGAV